MQNYRNLLLIALLLLIFGGGWAIWNAEQKVAPPADTSSSTTQSDATMIGQNVSFTVTEGAVKKWKLEAEKAVYNKTRTSAQLSNVKGEFYNEKGEPVLQFTAPEGQYTNKNNEVLLSGGVVAHSAHGVIQNTQDTSSGPEQLESGTTANGNPGGQLTAPSMRWGAKTKGVTATGGVELTFPEGKSTAQTCHFTLDFSKITLEGGVASSITTP